MAMTERELKQNAQEMSGTHHEMHDMIETRVVDEELLCHDRHEGR
jgi:hypothetical protein